MTARSIYRRPVESRWAYEKTSAIAATPWSLREVRFADGAEAATEPARREEGLLPIAFRINYADLVEHGFAVGCPQCEFNQEHKTSKAGITHSHAFRQRLLDAFMATPTAT